MTKLEKNLASLQLKISPFEYAKESINEKELKLVNDDFGNGEEINFLFTNAINERNIDLGLVLQAKKTQKELILNELSEISRLINLYRINTELIDYTIPFFYDATNSNSFITEKHTQLEEVIAYFLFFGFDKETLKQIESNLLRENGFFGLEDVKRVKGKFRYKGLVNQAKSELKKIGLFDSKGKITKLGLQVKESFRKKNINTEKATKLKNGPSYRVGISVSIIEREVFLLAMESENSTI